MAGPLLPGREAALIPRPAASAAVARLIASLVAGRGGLLTVTGPPGSGKTTLAEEAAALAAAHAFPVRREPARPDGPPSLLIVDLPVPPEPAEARRLASGTTAVLVTAPESLGLDPEVRLGGFPESSLAGLLDDLPEPAVHAIWLASGGLPGPALDLAVGLPPGASAADVVSKVLDRPSRTEFLALDTGPIRLLEEAAASASASASAPGPVSYRAGVLSGGGASRSASYRARVLSRLARELLADPTAAGRRRALADEAAAVARASGDPGLLARVLDDRLHALWDPIAAPERLATSAEIVELARRAGDAGTEMRGLMWRFTAQAELADLDAAEVTLTAYRRAGELAGDVTAAVIVAARQAMLATVRGRLEAAAALAERVRSEGHRIGLADTDRLVASLTGRLTLLRGEITDQPERLHELARRLPGHFYEATAALVLTAAGRLDEAALELLRLRPAVLAGGGPRWLGAVADLAMVAAEVGDRESAEPLYEALLPFEGRLVVWAGGNTITYPVDHVLGRLAVCLDRPASHLDDAIALERRLGALPWLVASLRARSAPGDLDEAATLARRLGLPPAPAGEGFGLSPAGGDAGPSLSFGLSPAGGDAGPSLSFGLSPMGDDSGLSPGGEGFGEWSLVRDGDRWRLRADGETAWLSDARGVPFLRALLAAPGREIAALDLVAGGAGLRRPDDGPVVDEVALRAYRKRLADLDADTEAADRAGDQARSVAVQAERTALLGELRRATGLSGRPRRVGREAERARVNVTRALRATIGRVAVTAPLAAAHLAASVRTGHQLRYQPAQGGPPRWHL
jgi:hypothetical protein